jgi:hypothetical protein
MTETGRCLATLGMLIASAASRSRARRVQGHLANLRRFCPIVPGEAAPYPSCAVKG